MQKHLEQLQWRYATKTFDPARKLSDAEFASLTEVLRLSPSSFGQQPWKFITIENKELRATLKPYTFNQPQVVDASHFVVLCAKDNVDAHYVSENLEQLSAERAIAKATLTEYEATINGFINAMSADDRRRWAEKQVYIALGFLLSAAAQHGIDACPIEGFSPTEYDRILGLDGSGYHSTVCVALGYRAADDGYASLKKVRASHEKLFDVV